MDSFPRRDLFKAGLALGALGLLPNAAQSAMGPNDKFDLLIRNANVTMATAAPARVIGRIPKHGTLQVGAPADLSMLDIVEGPVSFVDTRENRREGKVFLRPAATVVAGVAFGRPYQAPFTVR